MCKKIPFKTDIEAREELIRIVESNDWRIWRRVSPCRHYLCSCGFYHLTSKKSLTY